MIFVNFKTYKESTGSNAVNLAKIISEVSEETGVKMVAVVQPGDIREVSQAISLEVWSQKIDPVEYGAHTGSILPEAVVEDGARGVFINHSENKANNLDEIQMSIVRANDVSLKTLIFANTPEELQSVVSFHPTYVSYEPAELVGSTTNSVSQAKREVIKEAVEIAKQAGIPLIVGAGIHSVEDVLIIKELGAVGIAVATNIVKATNPREALLALAEGFR